MDSVTLSGALDKASPAVDVYHSEDTVLLVAELNIAGNFLMTTGVVSFQHAGRMKYLPLLTKVAERFFIRRCLSVSVRTHRECLDRKSKNERKQARSECKSYTYHTTKGSSQCRFTKPRMKNAAGRRPAACTLKHRLLLCRATFNQSSEPNTPNRTSRLANRL